MPKTITATIKVIVSQAINKVNIFQRMQTRQVMLDDVVVRSMTQDVGKYTVECFNLSRIVRCAPSMIAEKVAEFIEIEKYGFSSIESIGPYLNFYLNEKNLRNESGNDR